MLLLNDIFWTYQGEASNAGQRALFVRMPFCDLQCSWCDTEFNSTVKWSEDDFVKFAVQEQTRFAVITGGEPMINKTTPRVIEILRSIGFTKIATETNGNWPIVPGLDWVCVSPKREQKKFEPYHISSGAMEKANEFKYVVDDNFDWSVLDRHNTSDGRHYWLSPEYNNMNANVEKITEWIKMNQGWKMSLQTHKWLGIA